MCRHEISRLHLPVIIRPGFGIIPPCQLGCLRKCPRQIFVAVLLIPFAFPLIVTEPFARNLPAVRYIISRFLKPLMGPVSSIMVSPKILPTPKMVSSFVYGSRSSTFPSIVASRTLIWRVRKSMESLLTFPPRQDPRWSRGTGQHDLWSTLLSYSL